MKRPLYAACPLCGNRAQITKMVWDWDRDENVALIKCDCGNKARLPYSESRVIRIDINNPYMHEENNHFDLLVPPGWTEEKWERLSKVLTQW